MFEIAFIVWGWSKSVFEFQIGYVQNQQATGDKMVPYSRSRKLESVCSGIERGSGHPIRVADVWCDSTHCFCC